jgi:hypothetical protein
MYNYTLDQNTLTPLDLTTFLNVFDKKSIFEVNKYTRNVDRKGIWFEDKPELYTAKINVAGYDKSEIKINEEKTNGSSRIDVVCENKDFPKIKFSFHLPSDADSSTIKSTLKNSILTISCQVKKPKSKSSVIEIE